MQAQLFLLYYPFRLNHIFLISTAQMSNDPRRSMTVADMPSQAPCYLRIWTFQYQKDYFLQALLVLSITLLSTTYTVAQSEITPEGSALSNEAPTLRFEELGLAEGLSQGSGNTIMQDKEGFIWISTQGGLHRWDGQEFKVFSSVPFDTTSLSDTWVWSATEASDGNLWVATAQGGLNKLDPETGTAKHYRHDPDDSTSISADFTFYALEGSNGDLWVSTLGNGLNRMRKGEDGLFSHYRYNPEDPDDPNSISSDAVYWLSEDTDGYLWAGGNNGINRIDPETEIKIKKINNIVEPGRVENPVIRGAHPVG